MVWSRRESTSTNRTNYAEILLVLETILRIAVTALHPLAHHTEFLALQQDLVSTRRHAQRQTEERSVPV